MDKRKAENLRVKRSITDALFSLMEEKSLADIRITEIVMTAGVARVSFYRNYATKEDVLLTLIRDILEEFRQEMDLSLGTVYTYENIRLSFTYFRKYQKYLLDLQRCGFFSVLLEEMNHFHESVEGNMSHASIEKYELYMYIGAMANTAVTWLLDGEAFSTEEIAGYFFRMVRNAGIAASCLEENSKKPDVARTIEV